MTCQACGVEKDPKVLETYPYPEDDLWDEPIEPLLEIACQDYVGIPNPGPFKKVLVCHACWHKLDPDMWISRNGWEALNPKVPWIELENER